MNLELFWGILIQGLHLQSYGISRNLSWAHLCLWKEHFHSWRWINYEENARTSIHFLSRFLSGLGKSLERWGWISQYLPCFGRARIQSNCACQNSSIFTIKYQPSWTRNWIVSSVAKITHHNYISWAKTVITIPNQVWLAALGWLDTPMSLPRPHPALPWPHPNYSPCVDMIIILLTPPLWYPCPKGDAICVYKVVSFECVCLCMCEGVCFGLRSGHIQFNAMPPLSPLLPNN